MTRKPTVTLKQVFESRVKRAARVLESPEAGPTQIKFHSQDLGDIEHLTSLHEKFPKKREGTFYLYQISLVRANNAKVAAVRSAFRRARSSGAKNMSRDNKAHPHSSTLYVGTSTSMYNRFRTHLGIGNGAATWALYLSYWAAGLKCDFLVEYYQFRDTISEDVELVEGVLWDSLTPLFGKKGGR
jgi:hypothetical protein